MNKLKCINRYDEIDSTALRASAFVGIPATLLEGKHSDNKSLGVQDEAATMATALVIAGSKHCSGCAHLVAGSTSGT